MLGLVQVQEMESSSVPKVASGFGAGFGRHGEVCGALSGAIMALGLRCGRENGADAQAKEAMYALVGRLFESFREECGTVLCRELIGCDLLTEEGREEFKTRDLHNTLCPKIAVVAAEQALRLMQE